MTNNMDEIITIEKCKYALPCGWCDRFNKICHLNNPIKINEETECDHEWTLADVQYKRDHKNDKVIITRNYKCNICGAVNQEEIKNNY